MKKIAIISTHLSRGGAERVSVYLAEYFTSKGCEVTIITTDKLDQEYTLPPNVKREILLESEKHYNFVRYFLALDRKLTQVLKANQIETAVIMGVPNCIYAVFPCLRAKVRLIVSERNDPANFNGKKLVKFLSRRWMKRADAFIFQTQDAKNYYAKMLKGRGAVIPNPLLHPNLPDVYTGERERIIVTAGRLTKQKNQALLINAFSKVLPDFPDYKLVIYGEGSLRETLQAQIDSMGLSDIVTLPGNHSNVLHAIHRAAAFVLPSDFEGMPNALIEAMAIGLPSISTDCPCGGPKELIRNGENGLLVPVNDEAALVAAMRRMLSNPQAANEMGLRAMYVRDKLHVDKIGQAWLDVVVGNM